MIIVFLECLLRSLTRKYFFIRILNFLLPNKSYFGETPFCLNALNIVSSGVHADFLPSDSGFVKLCTKLSLVFRNTHLNHIVIYRSWIKWGAHNAGTLCTQLLFLEICNPNSNARPMGSCECSKEKKWFLFIVFV